MCLQGGSGLVIAFVSLQRHTAKRSICVYLASFCFAQREQAMLAAAGKSAKYVLIIMGSGAGVVEEYLTKMGDKALKMFTEPLTNPLIWPITDGW